MVLAIELFKACCGSVSKMATFASLDPQGGPPTKTVLEYLARHNVTIEELRSLYSEALQKGSYMLELALQDSEGSEQLLSSVAEECAEDTHSIREGILKVCQKLRTVEVIEELAINLDSNQLQTAFQEVGLKEQMVMIPPDLLEYFSKLSALKTTDAALVFLLQKSMLFYATDYQFRSLFVNDSRLKILATLNSHTKMKLRMNSLAKQITAKEKQKSQLGTSNTKDIQVLADEIALYQKALKRMTAYVESQATVLEILQNITDSLEQQISPEILEKVKELSITHAKGKKDNMGDTGDVLDAVEEVARLTKQAIDFLGADRIDFSHSLLTPILENQKQKIEKALTLFEKIPNTHNQKPVFANRLGVILNAMGVPDKAAEYFRRALLLPNCSSRQDRGPIESNLFYARLNQGSFDAALKYMLQSIKGGNEECSLFDTERYIPKQILGVGGMGVTFLCEDIYEKRTVVVKTLWRYATGGLHETFAEAFMAKKMDNPRIIKIFDIGRHRANRPFIVMEYCPGIDLQQYILKVHQGKPIFIDEALDITLEVAKGLLVAHQQNPPIVHRDIKPSNILYSPDTKNVKIIDFGIACMLPNPEEISRSSTRNSASVIAKNIAGTWGYMAPEQQRGEQNLTPQCDIFSLGKLLMFLLTSKTPPPENTFALKQEIREHIGELVGYCLMPHCDERYTTEQVIVKIQEIQIKLHRAPIRGPFPTATVAEDSQSSGKNSHFADVNIDSPMQYDSPQPPVTENVEIMDPIEANGSLFGAETPIEVAPVAVEEASMDSEDVVANATPVEDENSAAGTVEEIQIIDAVDVSDNGGQEPVGQVFQPTRVAPQPIPGRQLGVGIPTAILDPSFAISQPEKNIRSYEVNQTSTPIEMQSLFDSATIEGVNDSVEQRTNSSDATTMFSSQSPSSAEEVIGIEELPNEQENQEQENVLLEQADNPPEEKQNETPQYQNEEGAIDDGSISFEIGVSDISDNAENNTDESGNANDESGNANDESSNANGNGENEEISNEPETSSNVDYGDGWLENPNQDNVKSDILVKDEAETDNSPAMRRTIAIATDQITLPPGYHWEGQLAVCDKDGATMVYIPRGVFSMGDEDEPNAVPVKDVLLDAYFIDECPVTWFQYNFFCQETKRPTPPREFDDLDESQPVINITWEDAAAYAAWASKNLPTEAQWEKAAKGGAYFDGDETMIQQNKEPKRHYAWGNEQPNVGDTWYANCEGEPLFGMRNPSPVKKFPLGISPYGCYDLCGNVWEWCSDWYDEKAYTNASTTNPRGPKSGKCRVIRGGSWNSTPNKITTSVRSWMEPDLAWNVIGFRTVRNLTISAPIKK